MRLYSYSMLVYALLLLIGGLVGYFVSGSKMSLIMGCGTAALGFIAWYGLRRAEGWGYALGINLAFLLGIFFFYRYYQTGKVAPGLFFSSISFVEALYLTYCRFARK